MIRRDVKLFYEKKLALETPEGLLQAYYLVADSTQYQVRK